MDEKVAALPVEPITVPTKANYRYVVLLLVFLATVLNYVDRTNLSIAAPAIKHGLELNPVEMGLVLSAFGWAYTAMQIPAGFLVDRFGTR